VTGGAKLAARAAMRLPNEVRTGQTERVAIRDERATLTCREPGALGSATLTAQDGTWKAD
jgi:hypothetical protein